MKDFITLLSLIFSFFVTEAQQANTKPPCSAPEASQFDFWTGDWELTWNDTSHGTNTIQKIMGGCTIQENFSDPEKQYDGKSWSVYNPGTKMWQQTWVDNAGGYIVLTGRFENNEMTLTTAPRKLPDGSFAIFHMVFYNISADKFDWKWEMSKDDGKTWATNWLIHYKRRS